MASVVKVWDPVVRLVHWGLAAAIVADLLNEAGANPWHRSIGYAALALVLARLVWGFAGSRHARLAGMLRSAAAVRTYVAASDRGAECYAAHNPLGALMAFALWALVVVCGVTGWMLQLDALFGDETLQRLHSISAYTIAALAAVHVTGAVVASARTRTNLVKAMFTGVKRLPTR